MILKMSWFKTPYSKKIIEREENKIIRRYGKGIKRLSEIKEYDSLSSVIDDPDQDDDKGLDENKDEKFDYSDNDELEEE